MYLLYLTISIIEYIFSVITYKKRLNPISIYLLVWNGMIGLYELNLVYFIKVSYLTWITVILFQLIYTVGCIFGYSLKLKNKVSMVTGFDEEPERQSKLLEADLRKVTIALCLISSVAIIPNFIVFISKYGLNFMGSMNDIYQDRLDGTSGFSIPYLGKFVYLGVVIAGILLRRYGFSFLVVVPCLLSILEVLPGGGRSGIVLILLLFILPYLLVGKCRTKFNATTENGKIKKKKNYNVLIVLFLLVVLFAIFWKMSTVRSSWITVDETMSPAMIELCKISPAIYKTYVYIVGPFPTLSVFLENPEYEFGINSLGMFRNILNKMGFDLEYQRYQTFYNIPMEYNVASYIREFIQDFTYLGALIATFAFAVIFSVNYKKSRLRNNVISESVVSILGTVVIMSFFVFYFRETVFWIMIFALIPITYYLNRRIRRPKKYVVEIKKKI